MNPSTSKSGKIIKTLMLASVGVGVLGWFVMGQFNSYKENRARESVAMEKEESTLRALKEMVSRTGASTNWDDLAKRDYKPRTIDLQDALIRGGRPALFYDVELMDLKRDGEDKYVVSFSMTAPIELRLELTCTPEQAQRIRTEAPDSWDGFNFAVVAEITKVKKMRLAVKSHSDIETDEESFHYASSWVELETSDVFSASGIMVNFVHSDGPLPHRKRLRH